MEPPPGAVGGERAALEGERAALEGERGAGDGQGVAAGAAAAVPAGGPVAGAGGGGGRGAPGGAQEGDPGRGPAAGGGCGGARPELPPRGTKFSRARWLPLISGCLERLSQREAFAPPAPGASPEGAGPAGPAGPGAPAPGPVFQGPSEPGISVREYLDRLFKYFQCSPACLFAALWYIRRVSLSDPFLHINRLTVHR